MYRVPLCLQADDCVEELAPCIGFMESTRLGEPLGAWREADGLGL